MEKEIYSPMEKILIAGAQLYEEAAATKAKEAEALKLDLMLLEMEEKMGLMDGIALQEWIL